MSASTGETPVRPTSAFSSELLPAFASPASTTTGLLVRGRGELRLERLHRSRPIPKALLPARLSAASIRCASAPGCDVCEACDGGRIGRRVCCTELIREF